MVRSIVGSGQRWPSSPPCWKVTRLIEHGRKDDAPPLVLVLLVLIVLVLIIACALWVGNVVLDEVLNEFRSQSDD
jgi:hypothetical protein